FICTPAILRLVSLPNPEKSAEQPGGMTMMVSSPTTSITLRMMSSSPQPAQAVVPWDTSPLDWCLISYIFGHLPQFKGVVLHIDPFGVPVAFAGFDCQPFIVDVLNGFHAHVPAADAAHIVEDLVVLIPEG